VTCGRSVNGAPGPRVAAVVLAAGESSRLGAFKPLLPWPAEESAEPLVAYQVRQLLTAGAVPVIVVTGNRAAEVGVVARSAGATVVHNPCYEEGKATSVRVGVAAAPEDTPLLIVGVDQPRPAWLFHRLIETLGTADELVIPTYRGRRGHPPLFAARLRAELLAVQEETFGLRAIVQKHAATILHLEIGGPLVLVNLNTPADLAAARELFATSTVPGAARLALD
jgi:molybdenum cofactor cytidylyltransferase